MKFTGLNKIYELTLYCYWGKESEFSAQFTKVESTGCGLGWNCSLGVYWLTERFVRIFGSELGKRVGE